NVQLSERSAAGTASGGARLGVVQRLGVEVTQVGLTGDRVERVVTTAGDVISTRAVVVAAGYRSVELLRPLGVDLEVTPVRHSIAIVERTADFGGPHAVVADRVTRSYYRPEGGRLTLLGFSPPFEGRVDYYLDADASPTEEETARLVARYCQRFPTQERATL